MKTHVEITNQFHSRMCVVEVPKLPCALSAHQQRKVEALCGSNECRCRYHTMTDTDGNAVCIDSYTEDGRWVIDYVYPKPEGVA